MEGAGNPQLCVNFELLSVIKVWGLHELFNTDTGILELWIMNI